MYKITIIYVQNKYEHMHRHAHTQTHTSLTHHTLPAKEVRDDFFVDVIHQTTGALVVIPRVNKELLPGVLINEGADLNTGIYKHNEYMVSITRQLL